MAGKKDFAGMNTSRVYDSIEKATSTKGKQGKASPQEAAERAAEMKTQGRKGCKLTRINMAFTPENHDFIKLLAKATGRTMTELTNDIIAAYRAAHPGFTEQANDFLKSINNLKF